jgi:hypothetical protein
METHSMSNVETIITVNVEKYSNGYVATSNWSKGLFACNQSFDSLIKKSVPTAIRLIMKAKYGRDFIVQEKGDELEEATKPVNKFVFCAKQAVA